jgi:hypothetical protein
MKDCESMALEKPLVINAIPKKRLYFFEQIHRFPIKLPVFSK